MYENQHCHYCMVTHSVKGECVLKVVANLHSWLLFYTSTTFLSVPQSMTDITVNKKANEYKNLQCL